MTSMLRFSYQSDGTDVAFQAAMLCLPDDPMAPLIAVLVGARGMVLVSSLPEDQFRKVANAAAQALGGESGFLNDPSTGL